MRPLLLVLLLAGCAGAQGPDRPDPRAIQKAMVELGSIPGDARSTWAVGQYAVRSACHSYLSDLADRSARLGMASDAAGIAGVTAGGFLSSMANPIGAGLATGTAALAESFLTMFQQSGAMSYTPETSTIIRKAMDVYESAAPVPASVAQAMSFVDDMWWLCSPGGYATLVSRSIVTAQVSAEMPRGLVAGPALRPRVLVNGQ